MTRNSRKALVRVIALVLLAAATWWLRAAPLPTSLQGALLVGCAVLVGDLGLRVCRRVIPFGMLKRHSSAQMAIFAVVGTVYGLIGAFVIVVVWEDFSTAETTVSQEANALADLERMSRGFDVVTRRQVQEAARTYAFQVVHEEWPAMAARAGSSERAQAALTELWHLYTDMSRAQHDQTLYDHSIERLGEVDDNRRLRLTASQDQVPPILWLMLYLGGFATVALAYFFESPSDWFHRLVIAMLSGTIMFSIFLVVALEGPFDGDVSITPDAFEFVLDHMQNLEK